jgi:hypothetical protein
MIQCGAARNIAVSDVCYQVCMVRAAVVADSGIGMHATHLVGELLLRTTGASADIVGHISCIVILWTARLHHVIRGSEVGFHAWDRERLRRKGCKHNERSQSRARARSRPSRRGRLCRNNLLHAQVANVFARERCRRFFVQGTEPGMLHISTELTPAPF